MRTVLRSTPNGAADTLVLCRRDTFVVRQGLGEAQQSIVILSIDEAVELVGIIADAVGVCSLTDADHLRIAADKLHDAADRIEGTALTELTKDIQ